MRPLTRRKAPTPDSAGSPFNTCRSRLRSALLVALLGACPWAVAQSDATVTVPAGASLWDALEKLARQSQRSLLFEVDAAQLRALPDPGAAAADSADPRSLQQALDRILHNTPFGWRQGSNGEIVIFRASAVHVPLETLSIDGVADGETVATPGQGDAFTGASVATQGQRIDGAELARFERADYSVLGRRAPNVTGVGPQLAIRGVEQGVGLNSTVQLTLDGMPLSAQYAVQGLLPLRLAAIDYLRGPRTSLDALGGLGGAIRISSELPQATRNGELRAGVLEDGGRRLNGYWAPSDAFSGHTWALNATAIRRPQDIDDAYSSRGQQADQAQIIGRGVYEPDALPELAVQWSGMWHRGTPRRRQVVPPAGSPNNGFDPLDRYSFDSFSHDETLEFKSGHLRIDYQFTPSTLVWISGSGFDSTLRDRRNDEGAIFDSLTRSDSERFQTVKVGVQEQLGEHWSAIAEWSRGERRIQEQEVSRTPIREFYPVGLTLSDPEAARLLATTARQRLDEQAGLLAIRGNYAPWSWGVGMRGVRYDRKDQRSFRAFIDPADCAVQVRGVSRPCSADFPSVNTLFETPSKESHWTPTVDLSWAPNAHSQFSLWWRRGLLPGGARANPSTGQLVPYRAERSESIDLQASFEFPSPDLQLNATLFQNQWSERQVRVDLPSAQSYLISNAGGARARGAEVQLRWTPNEHFSAWLELGFLNTRFERFPLPVAGGTVDLEGKQLPGAPRYSRGAGLAWHDAERWSWQANVWQVDEAFSDAVNTDAGRRPGYTVVDLYLQRSLTQHWAASLSVSNAFDRRYLEHVRVAGVTPTAREYFLGDRRSTQLELSYRW